MVLMGVESLISSCFMDEIDASCDEGILITQVELVTWSLAPL